MTNELKTMDLKSKAKLELENRLKKVEDFIAEKGVGSRYLAKAKKTQRNINLMLVAGSILTVVGVAVWALSGSDEEDEV